MKGREIGAQGVVTDGEMVVSVGRVKQVASGRPHAVATKLSDVEIRAMDAKRRSLTRAEYLRWLILKDIKGA